MNDRERAICARLREFRARLGWSQAELAKAIGTTRDQLATVEYARNPLRYWLADRLCQKFDVCQQWLASGEGAMPGYVEPPPELGIEIGHRELFSGAFDRRVGHIVKRAVRETEAFNQRVLAQTDIPPDSFFQDYLYTLTQAFFRRVPVKLQQAYFGALMAASSYFFQRHSADVLPLAANGNEKPPKIAVDSDVKLCLSLGVGQKSKALWEGLRQRISAALRSPGAKTRLARKMGVSRPAVSQWIAHKGTMPTGEMTLRLLAWVQEEEEKPKSPRRAVTRRGPKTQLRKSQYEKPKSGPKKG